MANPKFTKTGYSDLEFGRGILYPARRPQQKIRVVERTAGGQLRVENLGITVHTRPIALRGLTAAVITSLRTWHEVVGDGEFTFVDEDGTSNTVIWLDDTLDAPQYAYGRYSVDILLEVVS